MPLDFSFRARLLRASCLCAAAALAGCASVPPPATPVESAAPAAAATEPTPSLLPALQAAHPRTGNPARARALLEALLAANDDASRALHPYARTLLEQIAERQRLDAANVRLAQQLERSSQQLRDSQQLAEDLQRKIDALAEIERRSSVRAPKRALAR